MPLGYFFMANWKKILLIGLSLIVLAPFVLLHLFVLCARLFEPRLTGAVAFNLPTTNGLWVRVYHRDSPRAVATLVFIHGSPANARAFHAQFADRFPDVNLFTYDRPGFGASPANRDSMNLHAQVAALGFLLQAARTTNCVLIGHSYGAAVALEAALDFPQFVRGIVLVGGSIDPAQERTLAIQRLATWPLVGIFVPPPLRNCNRELMALRTDLLALRPRLSRLEASVVMVHGTKDRLVPLANVDFLERELVHLGKTNLWTRIILPEANHFIPWEHPQVVHDAIERLMPLVRSHLTNRRD